ncbi:Testisinlike, partial [Caligus rogercresseyi]
SIGTIMCGEMILLFIALFLPSALGNQNVSLKIDKIGSNNPFCGASLINIRWVITAAHCVYPEHSETFHLPIIVLGDYNTKEIDDPNKLRATACAVEIHPGYVRGQENNDIALIRLCYDLKQFTKRYFPIDVAEPKTIVPDDTSLVVAGWGVLKYGGTKPTHILRTVVVSSVNQATCKKAYNFIDRHHLCAGLGYKDACQGDSGGPLWMYDKGEKPILVGIVSTGKGCGQVNYPGVYTRVSAYFFWIVEVMGDVYKPE